MQLVKYIHILQNAQVKISMTDLGAAWQNGYVERLIRTIKEEEVDLPEYSDYCDAYMKKRIHSALEYLTLFGFEKHSLGLRSDAFTCI